MDYNDRQKSFFEHMANMQEASVEICMTQNKCDDEKTRRMLYDATYVFAVNLMTMIDGYSNFSKNKSDIVDSVTGEGLKNNPFIELHDSVYDFLKQG